jgi:hypothetical protein
VVVSGLCSRTYAAERELSAERVKEFLALLTSGVRPDHPAVHRGLICIAAASVVDKPTKEHKTGKPRIIPVWPKDAPGSEKWTQKEVEHESALLGAKIVRNVVRPTLTMFLPEPSKANGTAVIVGPGGGFYFLYCEGEGPK